MSQTTHPQGKDGLPLSAAIQLDMGMISLRYRIVTKSLEMLTASSTLSQKSILTLVGDIEFLLDSAKILLMEITNMEGKQ
jgi:hypothetical protein